ncbi:winged helix DNA-binding domain-containing protein [Oryzobacter sp. R7]|uniref:winged helix DNA-binding domain-containing protein n=1 Tax=Oryzobacter faecalis TaxID=3388656 RepID=UPI00398D2606
MPHASLPDVRRRRLASQRLTAAGLARGADVVRLLTCVQSQDAALAAWSLGQRMRPGVRYADVLREQSSGGWVRTHILRPTWHFVAPEDLRWVQAATGSRIESSLAGRHRQLDLPPAAIERALESLRELLTGPAPMTRAELTAAFAARGLPSGGEQMAHQLVVAELRAVICSGPPRGTTHTYVLADETVPPAPLDGLGVDDARRELTRRFVAGHGPASERDLARWATLTLGQVRAALADLAGELEQVEVGGETLWVDPATPSRTTRPVRAFLLQTFDEVCLTYPTTGFPRRAPDTTRTRLLSEAGGGIVVLDGEDVGTWKRTVGRESVAVDLRPDLPLSADDDAQVGEAAERLAMFIGRPLDLRLHPPGLSPAAPDGTKGVASSARDTTPSGVPEAGRGPQLWGRRGGRLGRSAARGDLSRGG